MIVLKGPQPLVSITVARAGRLRVIFHLFYQVASGLLSTMLMLCFVCNVKPKVDLCLTLNTHRVHFKTETPLNAAHWAFKLLIIVLSIGCMSASNLKSVHLFYYMVRTIHLMMCVAG